jgi:hypothetical protein
LSVGRSGGAGAAEASAATPFPRYDQGFDCAFRRPVDRAGSKWLGVAAFALVGRRRQALRGGLQK